MCDKDIYHAALVQDDNIDYCDTCAHNHDEMDHNMMIENEEGAI